MGILWVVLAVAVGWFATTQFRRLKERPARSRPADSPPDYNPGDLPWRVAATERTLAAPWQIDIQYRDRHGDESKRTVRVLRVCTIPNNPEVRFQAQPDGERQTKTFYSSRVLNCFDAVTHEHVPDLGAYLRARP